MTDRKPSQERHPNGSESQTGNAEEDFEAIYRETYRKTLAYALRRTRTADDAHDVVAQTYMVAWRRLDQLFDAREPQAWLYAVAYRVLTNQRRSHRRQAGLVERVESQASFRKTPVDPARLAQGRDEASIVAAAMASLSGRDQEILRLVAFEELDHDEIAEVLGIKRPLVRSILYRARQRLNKALARQDTQPNDGSGHNTMEEAPNRSSQRSPDE